MTDKLPPGWSLVPLGALIEGVDAGKNIRCEERPPLPHERGVVKISAVTWGRFDPSASKTAPHEAMLPEGQRIRKGDFLISRANTLELVGATVIVEGTPSNLYLSDKVLRIRAEPESAQWLNWYLKSEAGRREIESRASGNQLSMRNIGQAALRSIPIPIPPPPEQRRVLARIEALSGHIGRARADLERIASLEERAQAAIVASAFRGELTDQLRSEDEGEAEGGPWQIPASWSWRRVGDVGRVGLGRQRSPANHTGPFMRSYVRAANITWDGWDLSDVKEINFAEPDFSRFRLSRGDVLLNEGSGSAKEVGKPAIWNSEITDCCFQNTLLRVQPKDCTSEYLYYFFLDCAWSGRFADATQGVNIHHIGKEGLAALPIPVPPPEEQEAITARLKRAIGRTIKTSREGSRALALLNKLERGILSQAFRGELVPQDPSEELASPALSHSELSAPAPARARRRRAA